MKPGFSHNQHLAVAEKVVGSYPQLQLVHLVCDGSDVGQKEARERGLGWLLL